MIRWDGPMEWMSSIRDVKWVEVGMSTEFMWNEEQRALREVVRDIADTRRGPQEWERLAATELGFDRDLWHQVAGDLGLGGLTVPEALGGAGAGVRELAVVAEEFGGALVPSPILATSALTLTALVQAAGSEAAGEVDAVIRDLAGGGLLGALAFAPRAGLLGTTEAVVSAELDSSGWRVSGATGYVLDGGQADVIVTPARTSEGMGLFLVRGDASGVSRVLVGGLDEGRRLAGVTFQDAPAAGVGGVDAGAGAIAAAVNVGSAVLAVEQVAVAAAMLDIAVDHAKNRVQFGRAIGSFQAVKHRLADMYVEVELARSTAYHALWVLDGVAGDPAEDPDYAVSLAHVSASQTARNVSAKTIQVLGGIGFTWEHPAHRYLKKAVSNSELLGGHRFHWERVSRGLLGANQKLLSA